MVRGDDGILLIPESYAVTHDTVPQEYQMPGSQPREVVGRCPFLWGQSLYILGRLLQEASKNTIPKLFYANFYLHTIHYRGF